MKYSVIITTYNWPSALKLCLDALLSNFPAGGEIIVADDGSKKETTDLIKAYQQKGPIIHAWQDDKGFRAARARNLAMAKANGEYCLFLDGDCIPAKNFIKRHLSLAEKGYFVAGNRVLCQKAFSQKVQQKNIPLEKSTGLDVIQYRLQKSINRILPFIYYPFSWGRHKPGFKWKGVKTCNLGVFKEDFIQVNGFDEAFTGWGYEDSEFVIRLLNLGIKHKSGRFATPVFHLWHPENTRENEQENLARLNLKIKEKAKWAKAGLSTHT